MVSLEITGVNTTIITKSSRAFNVHLRITVLGTGMSLTKGEKEDRRLLLYLKFTTAILYHPELSKLRENTALAGQDHGPCPLYMFEYHRDRMVAAVKALTPEHGHILMAIEGIKGLENMRALAEDRVIKNKPSKLRYTLDRLGNFKCESLSLGSSIDLKREDYFPKQFLHPDKVSEEQITWLVSISTQAIKPDFTTKHKSTARDHYDLAMKEAPKDKDGGHRVDVLVSNEAGEIMEGCSTTPYFWRDRWVTPSAKSGGNLGTTRRWALEHGLAVEAVIMKEDVRVGEVIVLSNGVRGFGYGRVVASSSG